MGDYGGSAWGDLPATWIFLKLAVLNDPLVGAVCTSYEVWRMVDELLVAQAEWLPQYAHQIDGAKARLAESSVPYRDYEGAARLPVRSVEEVRTARDTEDDNKARSTRKRP